MAHLSRAPRRERLAARAPARRHGVLLLLGGAGMALTAYILRASGSGRPLVCPFGSGCDVVQSSRYAAVFGIPVAFLGFLLYLAVFVVAAWPLPAERRVALGLPLVGIGLGASGVLTLVQLTAIRATCSLCLASAALLAAIAGVLLARPPGRIAPRTWIVSAAALVLTVGVLLGGFAASRPPTATEAYADALAAHLRASGATFYGAYWCPHCRDQKAMFGRAASRLPYVECDARSPVGRPAVCAAAGIRAYPTWDIGGRRYEGVLSLDQLARLSGFPPPR